MRYRASVSGVTGGMGVPRGPSLSWAPPAQGPARKRARLRNFGWKKCPGKLQGEEALGTRAGPGCPLRVSEGTKTPDPESKGRATWPDLWVASGLHGSGGRTHPGPTGCCGPGIWVV